MVPIMLFRSVFSGYDVSGKLIRRFYMDHSKILLWIGMIVIWPVKTFKGSRKSKYIYDEIWIVSVRFQKQAAASQPAGYPIVETQRWGA